MWCFTTIDLRKSHFKCLSLHWRFVVCCCPWDHGSVLYTFIENEWSQCEHSVSATWGWQNSWVTCHTLSLTHSVCYLFLRPLTCVIKKKRMLLFYYFILFFTKHWCSELHWMSNHSTSISWFCTMVKKMGNVSYCTGHMLQNCLHWLWAHTPGNKVFWNSLKSISIF